jgi:hypothetical protein
MRDQTFAQVDAGGSVIQPNPPENWFSRLLGAFRRQASGPGIPLEGGSLSVRIPPRGDLALTFPGVALKGSSWMELVSRPGETSSAWVREKDAGLGEWVQASLFPHPSKDFYDAFVNLGIQREGEAVLHYTFDGATWIATPPKAYPFDFFVRSASLSEPFEFFAEWQPKGATAPERSQTRTLKTGF